MNCDTRPEASGAASTNRSADSTAVDIDEDLQRSTESSLWVISEGPIGTVFSSEEAGGEAEDVRMKEHAAMNEWK